MPTIKMPAEPEPSHSAVAQIAPVRPVPGLIVLETDKDRVPGAPAIARTSAAEYFRSDAPQPAAGAVVINLCRSYKYLSDGYYCSLLAEARGQLVFPSIKTINDLSRKAIYCLDTSELDETLDALLADPGERPMPAEFSMDVFFGLTYYAPLAALARKVFETFPAPLLRVEFEHDKGWHVRAIRLQHLAALDERQQALCARALASFEERRAAMAAPPHRWRYHMAILQNPEETLPPSNRRALDKFVQAGRDLDIQVTLIGKKHFAQLPSYDALLIRETTAIRHHTYLFAKKAEREGLAVIDDSNSILRCTNKVYLAALLRAHGIPTPRTHVLQIGDLGNIARLEADLGYPMVMKAPDGAFCRGVSKVADRGQLLATAHELFQQSSLIVVQEYLYTEFDWRIGVLNRRPIFASQYFMSAGHWQVAKRDANGKAEFGMGRAMALHAVPPDLLAHAVRAANLIGDSLYGVDMKMTAAGPVVIEVNDNPNIDVGIEDGVLGDELYRIVLRDMVRRVESQR